MYTECLKNWTAHGALDLFSVFTKHVTVVVVVTCDTGVIDW
jgi:hypothetical protein